MQSPRTGIESRHFHGGEQTVASTTTQIGQPLTASQARAAVRPGYDSADHRDSINPALGEKIGAYALGKEDAAADAVAAAARVFCDSDWKTNREPWLGTATIRTDRSNAAQASQPAQFPESNI
jgi:hypothetical protein